MDYLQYAKRGLSLDITVRVLNLVINGLPSIHTDTLLIYTTLVGSFKPCYKWITFNTPSVQTSTYINLGVLNLVINGLPSILILLEM